MVHGFKKLENIRRGLKHYFGSRTLVEMDCFANGEVFIKVLLEDSEHVAVVTYNKFHKLQLEQAIHDIEAQHL